MRSPFVHRALLQEVVGGKRGQKGAWWELLITSPPPLHLLEVQPADGQAALRAEGDLPITVQELTGRDPQPLAEPQDVVGCNDDFAVEAAVAAPLALKAEAVVK